MGRKKKDVEAPAAAPAVVFAAHEDAITVPPGNPLEWSVADLLAATDVPVDRIRELLDEAAARGGAAGIPFSVIRTIWNQQTTAAQREQAFHAVAIGLVSLIQTGKGPVGHAGAEMA